MIFCSGNGALIKAELNMNIQCNMWNGQLDLLLILETFITLKTIVEIKCGMWCKFAEDWQKCDSDCSENSVIKIIYIQSKQMQLLTILLNRLAGIPFVGHSTLECRHRPIMFWLHQQTVYQMLLQFHNQPVLSCCHFPEKKICKTKELTIGLDSKFRYT